MNKRIFDIAIAGMVLSAFNSGAAGVPPAAKPNIVFILVDDLGWRDVDIQPDVRSPYPTPNLKKLAAQGMVFTDAYAACPVCSPTRASLMTGKSPAALRLTTHIPGDIAFDATRVPADAKLIAPEFRYVLPLEEITFAECLQADGYATGFFGKWHLSGADVNVHPENFGVMLPEFQPEHQGFDVNIGGCAYGQPPSYFSPYKNATIPDGAAGEYLTDRLTTEALQFIEQNRNRPFLTYLSFYSVHRPHQPKPELVDPEYGELANYAAMIFSIDENIGRLMAALDEKNLAENTIVIFTSDNGGMEGNSPLRGKKADLWEGGIRVPQAVRWPGVIAAGAVCREPVISYDFFPTLLDAARSTQKIPAGVEGISMLPLWKGESRFVRSEPLCWHFPHYRGWCGPMGGTVRSGDFKLIYSYEDGTTELYNLSNDSGEQKNLAAMYPEKTALLKTTLFRWLNTVHAVMPAQKSE
ncbi:MAG: sulfatase [Kiritimatiellales bacterium]